MQQNVIETIMGGVVIMVAASVLFFAYEGSGVQDEGGYDIHAKFDNITGINVGSDVRVGGIKVGIVSDLALDETTYQAIATLKIRDHTKLPNDSTAAIASSGLLGEKFVQVVPGAEERMLGKGGEIAYTQSSVSLEELIGKLMFSSSDSKDAKSESSTAN
jgi:phospholipid/cholesterol/gamma-HCH transport system substrate-binding protein